MIFKDESQLLQNIKLGHLYRVYLLYGEEKYLKDWYLKKLMKLAVGESFAEFNLHRFDGNSLDIDKVAEACESLPFLAEQRCVVVDKLDYEALNAADKAKMDALLQNPMESTVMILIVDKDDFLPKKSAKAKKLLELCDKAGVAISLGARSTADVVRFLKTRAESRGCSISRELCLYLIERCERGLLSLSNEMEKITSFATAPANPVGMAPEEIQPEQPDFLPSEAQAGLPPQLKTEITREQICRVTTKAMDASIYDLAKAILADRFEPAMAIVQELLYLRYQPILILSALSGAYIDLYIAKIAKNVGKGEAQIKESFQYRGRDFVVRKSLEECGRYRTAVLRASVSRLAKADYRLKSSRADDTIILEQTVTELFLIARS